MTQFEKFEDNLRSLIRKSRRSGMPGAPLTTLPVASRDDLHRSLSSGRFELVECESKIRPGITNTYVVEKN